MTTFVLVHGGFGSPAELAPVIPELEALGHRAIAVDLPCTDPAAMLGDYARTVVEAMAGIEGTVVVVGHPAADSLVPPTTQRGMPARLGVEPVEVASDHAVFTLRPRELAPLLMG
ncbi:MAG: alpha/beta fold hydrolase [Gaiella sp.]